MSKADGVIEAHPDVTEAISDDTHDGHELRGSACGTLRRVNPAEERGRHAERR